MSSLPPLATPGDLADYMQADLDIGTATLLLRLASGVVRRETRQRLDLATETITLRAVDGRELVLPQRPVVSVAHVVAHGLTLADWTLRGDRLLRWAGWWYLPGTTTYPDPGLVTVTYTHGYASLPDDIEGIVLALAARAYANPEGKKSETIGGYAYTFDNATAGASMVLTEGEKKVLADLRRTLGTASLRTPQESLGDRWALEDQWT